MKKENNMGKERYLIGYKGDRQCVFGLGYDGRKINDLKRADTFSSLKNAEKSVKKNLYSKKATKIIYKLIPVKIIKGEKL